ncbi:MAG: M20/M25/M40 family metallo-hydrolase [Ruminococcaceae bacterium]|nr:M20/M25/M40 family metallo-hydrolase [Oscillospiraceae bacterium]
MNVSGKRAFELLKKIGFIREAGSAEELKAAEILKAEIESFGVEAKLESFEVGDAVIEKAELEVLEPYNKKYEVTAYKCSASVENLEAEFVYAGNGFEVDLKNVKGKIVMVNGYMRVPMYRKLIEAGAIGFITMDGTMRDTENDSDLYTRKLRSALQAFGIIPGVNIRIKDAFEIVSKKASKVRMTTKNRANVITSHNVVAKIEGTEYPDEIISFGAHYDSVPFSTGVYDNGAGSVVIMELLRYFKENPPKRTVVFCWYGAEEIGLEGSKYHVKANPEEIEKTIFMINADVGGAVLGLDRCGVTADEDLTHYTDAFMKINGFSVDVYKSIYSSDSIPFADKGIPAVNFERDCTPGGGYIHCRHDVIDYLWPDALEKTGTHILKYSEALVNSYVFPFKRAIPDDIREKVDNYLYRKELKEVGVEI